LLHAAGGSGGPVVPPFAQAVRFAVLLQLAPPVTLAALLNPVRPYGAP
jgi:hypothetical protein